MHRHTLEVHLCMGKHETTTGEEKLLKTPREEQQRQHVLHQKAHISSLISEWSYELQDVSNIFEYIGANE
jgi:hypothetical protein